MNKKIIIPFFAVILVLLAIIATLIFFIFKPSPDDEIADFRMGIVENGQTEYIIALTKNAKDDYYEDLAKYIASRFMEIGVTMEITEEFRESANPKIYVGVPDGINGLTEEDINSIWVKDCLVKTGDNDLYIIAGCLSAGENAVDYLFEAYTDTANNNFIIPKQINLIKSVTSGYYENTLFGRISQEPVVYLVDDEYEIILHSSDRGISWVEIDGVRYYDEFCGIISSSKTNHRIYVPMDALDNAKKFTVYFRPVRERSAYSPTGGDIISKEYSFRPIDMSDGLQTYIIADSHGIIDDSIKASDYFGENTDLIVLCGDIADPKTMNDIYTIAKIARGASGGIVPVVYARGNHEARGEYADRLDEFVGTDHGKTYYTFRVDNLWAVVIDYGEDKDDSHEEYGGMINFSGFRQEVLEFLQDVVSNADSEYNASGIDYRLAICHVPVGAIQGLDVEMFDQWRDLCSQMNLDIMISAHTHNINFFEPGQKFKNQNYPVVICSNGPVNDFVGTAFTINGDDAVIEFVSEGKQVLSQHAWKLD